MRRVGLAAAAVVIVGLIGWLPSADAEDAPGCEGLEVYADAMHAAREDAIDRGDIDRDRIEQLDDQDPRTYSSDDYAELADAYLALNRVLRSVEPPEWAEELHQHYIEELGLLEQTVRAVSSMGLLAALAFTDDIDSMDAEGEQLKAETANRCPDFPSAFADWGDFAAVEGSATPVATPES